MLILDCGGSVDHRKAILLQFNSQALEHFSHFSNYFKKCEATLQQLQKRMSTVEVDLGVFDTLEREQDPV